ncbi:hypothetical protein [Ornithinimicrobium panacihumi]
MFITVRDGLIVDNVEVWTDVGMDAPRGTRSCRSVSDPPRRE